jgi:hypothetical protein
LFIGTALIIQVSACKNPERYGYPPENLLNAARKFP